jgi:hypothetical protein
MMTEEEEREVGGKRRRKEHGTEGTKGKTRKSKWLVQIKTFNVPQQKLCPLQD